MEKYFKTVLQTSWLGTTLSWPSYDPKTDCPFKKMDDIESSHPLPSTKSICQVGRITHSTIHRLRFVFRHPHRDLDIQRCRQITRLPVGNPVSRDSIQLNSSATAERVMRQKWNCRYQQSRQSTGQRQIHGWHLPQNSRG